MYPERRARLAVAARDLAVRRFDWKALGEKQRLLYAELLAGKRNRAAKRPAVS
jgi:hypothetical protein